MNLYNNYNSTNIKNLPQIDQIIDTDFLVVENYSGTNKLRFKDFVISPNNTSFYSSLRVDILSLSSYNNNLNTNLISLSTNTILLSAQIARDVNALNNANQNLDLNYINLNTSLNQKITNVENSVNTVNNNLILSANLLNNGIISNNSKINEIENTYSRIYNKIITFRWNSVVRGSEESPNYKNTFIIFQSKWNKELKNADILYVRNIVGIEEQEQPSRQFNGSLTFNLSTLFYNANSPLNTYMLNITSFIDVPESLTENYVWPFTSERDERKTFAVRIFTSNDESFNYF
jgi:hypothetical protein